MIAFKIERWMILHFVQVLLWSVTGGEVVNHVVELLVDESDEEEDEEEGSNESRESEIVMEDAVDDSIIEINDADETEEEGYNLECYEDSERLSIALTDAVTKPRAVMIKCGTTLVTISTVLRPNRLIHTTPLTKSYQQWILLHPIRQY
jgi:hypothetical protein